jgi:hypothetical protein
MPPVFEQVTFFYEVLMRFGDQVNNRGHLTGAHLQTLTQTLMDGNVIATQANSPQQLALLDSESGQQLSDVLGDVNAVTIITNQALTAENQALSAHVDALVGENHDLGSELDQSREQLATAQAEIQRLTELLGAAKVLDEGPALEADAVE